MSAQFPNVPAFPGVPPLARLTTPAQTAAAPVLNNTQYGEASGTPASALPYYGIADSGGNAIVTPDSVMEFDVSADSDINRHPVEPGTSGASTGFQSYNRVQQPVGIRMLLACNGKYMTRSAFVQALVALREGTDIVTIATPDTTYPNMVLKSFGYKKAAAQGAVTIWADTHWLEERSTNVEVDATPTVQPQGAASESIGTVGGVNLTAEQSASVNNSPIDYGPLPHPGQTTSPLPSAYADTAPPSGSAQ